ncbi:hypothetical protein VFPPC_18044 [Pochonia chlamydosporia 170]|uniref:Uncharacterized protein n=1 Tax=Pochonia chlamydosporia 170 TaxID=1380566 RepID=A0A219AQ88_METCM|nr:hypothetical protein VFPPC_18044 [Pochonia chlamydosporia 170]OWT42789.1 hypothetical protein VFPPC_18044 [Pochonia chlamydosporia 170]
MAWFNYYVRVGYHNKGLKVCQVNKIMLTKTKKRATPRQRELRQAVETAFFQHRLSSRHLNPKRRRR